MRKSGILLPVFSLPGKYGIGCFSKEAYQFIDFLQKCGQAYWQILPLGPTSYGDSPYQSFSTYAGNPYFIDLDEFVQQGFLSASDLEKVDMGTDLMDINYEKLYHERFRILRKAYEQSGIYLDSEFIRFKSDNADWLGDYALFMALKDFFGGKSFDHWPEDIRLRYGYALDYYREKLYFDIEYYEFLQYEFYIQWMKLKNYANEKGIEIIGDIPIYVAFDSADVWAHPELFQMDEKGQPVAVAGCPPDGFSATGQLWGNPLYRWDYHASTGFEWWVNRIRKCIQLYDVIRIDHFRGFDEYFSIPFGETTAVNGHWEKGAGTALFDTIQSVLPNTRIIAEDLGYITDTVRELVRHTGFPNMKVLEFAFDSRDSSGPMEYLPHNYQRNCVVYTGTHDNETTRGWLDSILPEELEMVKNYLGVGEISKKKLTEMLIRLASMSVAETCIIPIQDYLGLDNSARTNTPSTLGTNWRWRVSKEQLSDVLSEKILKITAAYSRLNPVFLRAQYEKKNEKL